jgi:hypothetical protein
MRSFPRASRLSPLLVTFLWLVGCESEPISPVVECVHEGAGFCWTDMGFHGEVTAIADTPWGLFRLEASGWTSAGFPGARVASIAVGEDPAQVVAGFGPGSDGSVPSAIVRSRNGGGSWEVADGGWSDPSNWRWADAVAVLPGAPEVVLWVSRSLILRSEDGTANWTAVEGSVEPVTGGLSVRDMSYESGSPTIYAGAAIESGSAGAYFLRTEDRGLTWEVSSVVGDLQPGQGQGPGAFRSVAHRPGFPDEIVAAKSFRDLYSDDGGATWAIGPREPELLLPDLPVVSTDLQGRLLLTVENGLWRLEPR